MEITFPEITFPAAAAATAFVYNSIFNNIYVASPPFWPLKRSVIAVHWRVATALPWQLCLLGILSMSAICKCSKNQDWSLHLIDLCSVNGCDRFGGTAAWICITAASAPQPLPPPPPPPPKRPHPCRFLILKLKMFKFSHAFLQCMSTHYRAENNSLHEVARMMQASWGRSGKQQQEQTSPNHVQRNILSSCIIWLDTLYY